SASRWIDHAKASSTKIQAPEKPQIPSSNTRRRPTFGIWILGLLWILDLGSWCFSQAMILIRLQKISRRYQMGAETIHALREVSLELKRGEYVAIMGPSGSGKSTLMNLIGCLDTPTSGEYELNGVQVSQMDDNQLAEIRNKEIGFIFQTFNLLPRSDALRNVELPMIYSGMPSDERRRVS